MSILHMAIFVYMATQQDIISRYTATVRNKFDTLQEKSERHTPNEKYESFLTANLEAAAEFMLT